MGRINYEASLAKAVAKAFKRAGFTATDIMSGQIELTDLAWQCPPLICDDTLEGHRFDDYLNYPIGFEVEALGEFWRAGMDGLAVAPTSVLTANGWRNISPAMRTVNTGERALRFSVPDTFPEYSPYSGHLFTMEVVHVLAYSATVDEFFHDSDNYWVRINEHHFGIKDGMIIDGGVWDTSIAGLVDSFAMSARGAENTACRYDLLAKVRSVLYENQDKFDEFTGVDWAIQSLAKLAQDRLCASLQAAFDNMLPDDFEAKRKLRAIAEAADVLDMWVSNDRVKMMSLHEILVPTVFKDTSFRHRIYNIEADMPLLVADKTIEKIRKTLAECHAELMHDISPKDRPAFERTPWTTPTS